MNNRPGIPTGSLLIILFLSRFTLLIAGSNVFLAVQSAGQQAEIRAEASLTPISAWETGRPKGSASPMSITRKLPSTSTSIQS